MSNFENAIHTVLKHEGGYVNDPVDPGGATKYGVSLRYLQNKKDLTGDFDHDGDVDVDDIKGMNIEDAIDIYKTDWWDKYHYSMIEDQDLATKVLDLSINMGSKQAHKLLQRAVTSLDRHLIADGILGEQSWYAIDKIDPKELIAAFRNQAAQFYLSLIAKKPKFKKYKNGWLKRAYS